MVNKKNIEELGQHFLKTGISFLNDGEILKSYEYIRKGLNLVTCDCEGDGWLVKPSSTWLSIPEPYTTNVKEFYFCKAFVLSYNDDPKRLYVALNAIEACLKLDDSDSLAYYLQGRIFTELQDYKSALKCFEYSNTLCYSPRTLFRIGLLKESHMKENGIEDLYNAYLENLSSSCCCNYLRWYSINRGIKPANRPHSGNDLINSFLLEGNRDPLGIELLAEFRRLLVEDDYWFEKPEQVIEEFGQYLRSNRSVYIKSEGDAKEYYDYHKYYTPNPAPDDFYLALAVAEEERRIAESVYHPSYHGNDYLDYREMYFDAMTDGQMGSYYDFYDSGESMDYIDDWAGN